MDKISASSLVLILLFVAATASRTNLYLIKTEDVNPDGAIAGVCKRMVEKRGYACQEHLVTTEDGYILSMQRIRGKGRDKPPVLLQHGLMLDGMTWVMNPPNQSLAFILADNGFDVWLANTRGTKYSRRHTRVSPKKLAYWNWTWDQLVEYDLPSTFQYVNNQTGQKLHYVGHSLGTLIVLAALSEKKLVDMLRSAALICPIAYLGKISSQIVRIIAEFFMAEKLYWLGVYEFNPRGEAVSKLLEDICNKPGIDCTSLMTAFTGDNCCLNSSFTADFLDHEPQPTSTKNIIHLAQMIRNGKVVKFDYGDRDENRKHYGKPKPPRYNMKNIPKDLPLFLSYGGKDPLSNVKDVKALLHCFKNHKGDKLVVQFIKNYAHADFVLAVNANQVVYDPLMAFFRLH